MLVIGAYLFQRVESQERPAAFLSQSLSAVQTRRSTIEKQCYAIAYALKTLEHLVGGRHFTLQTHPIPKGLCESRTMEKRYSGVRL